MTPDDFKAAFQNIPLPVNARDWICIYMHSFGPQPIYIGQCAPHELLKTTDARQNSEWHKTIAIENARKPLMLHVSLLHVVTDKAQADMLTAIEIEVRKPYCNVAGNRKDGNKSPIETWLIDRFVQYPSIMAASQALGIPAASISSHLAGRPGYKTVHKLEFWRVGERQRKEREWAAATRS